MTDAHASHRWIAVGRVAEAWGLEGWIRVHSYAGLQGSLLGKVRLWRFNTPSVRDLPILRLRAHGADWLALPETIDDRDKALALKGCEILVRRSDFPRTARGEYYWVDLIGCEVINRSGESLGRVETLEDHGAHPLLSVLQHALTGAGTEEPGGEDPAHAKRLLIPFVKHFVDRVDLPACRIHVDWHAEWS